jgi:4-amino-4-deoxy-L-arabinose transferase-like glycosyltransferase
MWRSRRLLFVFLALVVLATAGIRVRLASTPLERDEGEYAYAGQMLLRGVPPFAETYNMKMPGIYAAYAGVLAVFGESHRGIHLALLVLNVSTVILLFFLFRRWFDLETAATGAASYALLSLVPAALGITANAEHFVVFFAVAALLVLMRAIDSRSAMLTFVSGLIFGLSFLMKQHGIFLIAFGGVVLAAALRSGMAGGRGRLVSIGGLFVVGAVVPFGLLCFVLWIAGVFDRFWFWTFDYGRLYVAQAPLSVGAGLLMRRLGELIGDSPVLWFLAAMGLFAPLLRTRLPADKAGRTARFSLLYAFLGLSFLATCPGFFFRPHYFILMLPAIALASGLGITVLARRLAPSLTGIVTAAVLVLAALVQFAVESPVYFSLTPNDVSRYIYGTNPFPESLRVAEHIRGDSSTDDRIAVLGSEPQIYFYSGRRSATGYIYTYALMERHEFALDMQKEMAAQIESARPAFIVLVGVPTSWLQRADSERHIFEWARDYLAAHYRKVRGYPPGARSAAVELWKRVD